MKYEEQVHHKITNTAATTTATTTETPTPTPNRSVVTDNASTVTDTDTCHETVHQVTYSQEAVDEVHLAAIKAVAVEEGDLVEDEAVVEGVGTT